MTTRNLKFAGILTVLLITTALPAVAQKGLWYEERTYNFGCVGVDFKVFHDFNLINYGTDTVKVDSVKITCDCSAVTFFDSIVPPNDTVDFRLSFKTTNYYGPTSRSLMVYSNDKTNPEMEIYYVSTVGQWLYNVKPSKPSLFFIPPHRTKKLTIDNALLSSIEIQKIEPLDDFMTIDVIMGQADKGEKIELMITPRENLTPGTYLTNFRITFKLPDGRDPLLMTIPVKIAKY